MNFTVDGAVVAELEDMWPCNPSGLEGFVHGAAVGMGLLLMALAIQKNAPRVVVRRYWDSDPTLYNCFCPGCGVEMKRCVVGEEGLDNEWCGSCRY